MKIQNSENDQLHFWPSINAASELIMFSSGDRGKLFVTEIDELLEYEYFSKTQQTIRLFNFWKKLMFKLPDNYIVDRSILRCVYICYTPWTKLSANKKNVQLYYDLKRKDSVMFVEEYYVERESDKKRGVASEAFEDGKNLRFVNLCPIVLLSEYKLSTSTGNEKTILILHLVCFLYISLSSSGVYENLYAGFFRAKV